MYPPNFGTGSASGSNKNPDPHSDPHKSDKMYPHQFADDKPKCMDYEPILSLFQGS
jgi:hypothetical protein